MCASRLFLIEWRTCPGRDARREGKIGRSIVRLSSGVGHGWLAPVATPEKGGWFSARERQRMFAERYATKTPVYNL
jgi:hypothetical protein